MRMYIHACTHMYSAPKIMYLLPFEVKHVQIIKELYFMHNCNVY